MEIITTGITEDGKAALITLKMTPKEAQALQKLFQEGKLAEAGVTRLIAVQSDGETVATSEWTGAEDVRRRKKAPDKRGK